MVKCHCCHKLNVKRGLWTAEEDAKMLAYVSKHGTGNWTVVPKKAGLRRCGKSCRLRWTNYLRPDLKHENFTPEEEELIILLHATIGSRWSIIAQQLPGRTDNDVKNYWNTKLKKKLSDMGIDPVTHKPFSQVLADYGSINGGFSKLSTRIGSLNKDLKNAFTMSKSESFPLTPSEGFGTNMNDNVKVDNHGTYTGYNNSMDLLSQLQVIKLVTEASNGRFFNESSSSSSPSSSTQSTAAFNESSSLAFSWQDFLLEDELLPSQDENNNSTEFSCKEFSDQTQIYNGNGETSKAVYDGSLVDSMTDRENEMFSEFAYLLEEPLHN
ncbi:hypothetical protein SLE2022_289750 [Rubroshorea leprosula]